MEISQITLARLLFYCFFLGVGTGVLYDAFRLARIFLGVERAEGIAARMYGWILPVCKRGMRSGEERRVARAFVISIADFLCVSAATLGILVLCYSYNSGRVRFFTLLGAAVGFFLYRAVLSRAVRCVCRPAVLLARYLFLSILAVFCAPIVKMYSFVLYCIKKIAYLFIFTLEKKRKKVYNIEEEVFLDEDGKKVPRRSHRIMPERAEGGNEDGRK